MNYHRVNDEIYVAETPIVRLGEDDVTFLKRQALASPRRRARICAHRTNDDPLHEMVIAISADSYIHPHKHLGKSESFHIVEGEVDVAIFDDRGALVDVVPMGATGSGRQFFYRLSDSAFHTLVIRSSMLVVHEVTNGPFSRDRTVQAPFAPGEADAARAAGYMKEVREQVDAFQRSKGA